MDSSDERYLREISQRIQAVTSHERDRNERIVSLLRYKRASIEEISEATGLSRSRIYQVLKAGA